MARLEAVARGLFYPTPKRVYEAIALHLEAQAQKNRRPRLLDPCSGDGQPAAWVANALGAESFGIEDNETRAEQSRIVMDHVLPGDAGDMRLGHSGYSVLFLNPPYDTDNEVQRAEHAFLQRFTPALCPDGILVFIVPQQRIALSAHYLCAHYTDLALFRFPDPEWDQFNQIVLFARRKRAAVYDATARKKLDDWARAPELEPLVDTPDSALCTVPALPLAEVLFAPKEADPNVGRYLAERHGVMAQRAFIDTIRPPEETLVRPLMYLRRGHLAMLMVSGLADDFLIRSRPEDAEQFVFLVKGQQTKRMERVEVTEEELKEGVTRERERLETSIQVLNLLTGELWDLSDKPQPDPAQANSEQPVGIAA
jgi:Uncharacterised methyltransferase family (DUF6094)